MRENWIAGDRFHYLCHDCIFTGWLAGMLHFRYQYRGVWRESSCTPSQAETWVRLPNKME